MRSRDSGPLRAGGYALALVLFPWAGRGSAQEILPYDVQRIPIEKRWDRPAPASVPEVPVVLKEGMFYGDSPNHPVLSKDEQPYTPLPEGGFRMENGRRYFNRPLFYKGNMIGTGDRPMFLITRGYGKQWASKLRFAISQGGARKWLDEFSSVTTEFWPGRVQYRCRDSSLGVEVALTVAPGTEGLSSLFAMEVTASAAAAEIEWFYGDVVNEIGHKAQMWWLPPPELGTEGKNAAAVISPAAGRLAVDSTDPLWKRALAPLQMTSLEFFAGSNFPRQRLEAAGNVLIGRAPAKPGLKGIVAVVWGGEPNRAHLERLKSEMQRLRLSWGDALYREWYENLIGRAAHPRQSFDRIIAAPEREFAESLEFWGKIAQRVRFDLPDTELTSWANWLATTQEWLHWPLGQMSSVDIWGQQYLHISNLYSGWDYLGAHDQQQKWLRLFATSVRNGWIGLYHGIAPWSGNREIAHGGEEDQIAHYVNYVYTHWLWTADNVFVRDVWPFVKSLLERELMQNDPDGDGLFAARYPYWGPENDSWGPKTGLQTAQMIRALRGAAELAAVAGDNEAQDRYGKYAARSESALPSLWDSAAGVLGWRDPLDVLHSAPGAQESFLPIVRGAVDSLQAYQMLRYVRNQLWSEVHPGTARIWLCGDYGGRHHLGPLPDVAWGTVTAAALAGAMDEFYPVLRTYAHAYFFSSFPGGECSGVSAWGAGSAGMNDHNDGRMPALYMLGRGLFGLEPDYPRGRITIEPRFPSHWSRASIRTPDLAYTWSRTATGVRIEVTTERPVAKQVRLPVTREVKAVRLDGRPAQFRIEAGVGRAFVVVETATGSTSRIEVETAGPEIGRPAPVAGARGVPFQGKVEGAAALEVIDPQKTLDRVTVQGGILQAIPVRTGMRTAFLKATRGNVSMYLPLELEIEEPLRILDPRIDRAARTLSFSLANHTSARTATVRFRGEVRTVDIEGARVSLPLGDAALKAVTPGSNPIEVEIAGRSYRHPFIDWTAPAPDRPLLLDLSWDYHEEAASLFNTKFYYDTWQMGIDYPVLPPATYEWAGHRIENPKIDGTRFLAAAGVPFYLASERKLGGVYQSAEGGGPRNVLPVANWRPGLYPSNLVIPVRGMRLSKVYFLAYSWQRGHKTYHPNAELIANYTDGTKEIRQLIPPHSFMPQYGLESVNRNKYQPEVIPSGLPVGKERDVEWYLARRERGREQADLYDLPIDPTRELQSLEVRSVATESIFAIFGITLVRAH